MNADARAWELLGIAPTRDTRAIRTAYAERLKAIDPESDPQSFIALRAAFEAALAGGSTIEAAAPPVQLGFPTDSREPAEPVAAPPPDDPDRHARAILGLLYGYQGEQPWLSEGDQAALIAHWRALAADPRMDRIDHFAAVEQWASVVIAETSPLSAPILMLATERFGWQEADTKARSNPHIAEIARRYRMMQIVHMASRPRTSYRPAWIELSTPADPFSSHGAVDPFKVFELLAAAQYALPQVLSEFDPLRVDSWIAHAEQGYVPAPPSTIGGAITGMVQGYLVLLAASFVLIVTLGLIATVASWFG